MRIEIEHTTEYCYSAPVVLEPHVLRLRPRTDAAQRTEQFELQIEPQPAGSSELVDLDGNHSRAVWFEGATQRLVLRSTAVVETLRTNPYDFVWLGQSALPVQYAPELVSALQPYREAGASAAVVEYGRRVARVVEGDALAFLPALTRQLRADMQQTVRIEGDALPPDETLRRGQGACRDLAMLYIALCRHAGFAARFISGYRLAGPGEPSELHAWVEVYLPGGGWRGFDPSTGLAVADRHVAVAAGATPQAAAPVTGRFRGDPALVAELRTVVQVRDT